MKPILFNTEMVRAILDDLKTVTRRVVKNAVGSPADYGRNHYSGLRHGLNGDIANLWAGFYKNSDIFYVDGEKHIDAIYFKAPYQPGDILYVRETFCPYDKDHIIDGEKYAYKADATAYSEEIRKEYGYKWRPSIHMPREAARIFLRVTGVRVEQLQDITRGEAISEGANPACAVLNFKAIWDGTVKPADRARYGWAANPYVFVISFERISKEEALNKNGR